MDTDKTCVRKHAANGRGLKEKSGPRAGGMSASRTPFEAMAFSSFQSRKEEGSLS
jgi:hypothetical protein